MAPLIGYSLELNSRQDPGDPNLQCSPATPWSIFVFFATNYLAHCATVKNYPGSSELDIAVATALALFLPSSGITRALFSIVRRSRFKRNRNPLERAALAGALRMVVRNEKWIPMVGDRVKPKLDGYFTRGPDQSWSKVSYDRYGRRIVTEKGGGAGTVNVELTTARESGNDVSALPTCRGPVSSEIHSDNTPDEAQKPVTQNALRVNRVRVSENLVDDIDYDNTFSHTGSFQHHVSRDRQNFHGKALLPPGYSWAEVHGDAKLSWIGPQPGSGVQEQDLTGGDPNISSNYNWIQSLVAIFQAGSAGWALYRARGNQIQRYGYAAFGLTVVPYLIMSVINLLAQIATADYPNVFMVGSPEMDEARRHGGVFDGVVGHLEPEVKDNEAETPEYEVKYTSGTPVLERVSGSDFYPSSIHFEEHPTPKTREYGDIRIDTYTRYKLVTPKLKRGLRIFCFQFYMLPVMLGCLSLVVVGAMTHFANGESTMAQRGWIMSWLVVGIACGPYADSMSALFIPEHDEKTGKVSKADYSAKIVAAVLYLGICCVPAIGGFVVVAGMLREYGICESND
jgi:hypothetical protein